MFTEAESIKILRHDPLERKLPRPQHTASFPSPNTQPRSSVPGDFAPTALLSSQKGMSIPEIAGAIERTADQLRAIPRRTTTKSETLTRAQLEDLVFCRVRLPFSLSGYELNSQIAAVVRTSNMEQWWRTLHRFRYRSEVAIHHAEYLAAQPHKMSPAGKWQLHDTDWDMVAFAYHYLLLQSTLPNRFRQDPECFNKDLGRELSAKRREKRSDFLSQFHPQNTHAQQGRVSIVFAQMLDDWRSFHQAHVWALILQYKVLNNLVAVAWERAPEEERASPAMRHYIDTLKFVSSQESYAALFPAEVAPRFNLLALASRFGQEPLYRPRYLDLSTADSRFCRLEFLENHPDADGDFDNFLIYWRKHGERC